MILLGICIFLLLQLVSCQDIITTIAGTGSTYYAGDGGQATSTGLNNPFGLVLDSSGNVYIADSNNHCIRKVTVSTGIITTIAGTGTSIYSGDNGAATSAALNTPNAIALDSTGNIYIADTSNHHIRKVTVSSGIISNIAGTGTSGGYSGDNGQATSASLFYPGGIALDSTGNIYIADCSNHRIRKVTISTGLISTIAGTGASSYSGDNGAATAASLYTPWGITLDSAGNVYIGDTYNYRIRKVTISTGIITLIAGNGGTGSFSGDNGPATSASLYYPRGVALDSSGNVYLCDTSNYRVRKVTISTGIISTIAGGTSAGFSGDNDYATAALLSAAFGVALDSGGNVYISDSTNNRIRKVTVTTNVPSTTPTLTPSTASPSTYPSLSPSTVFIISTFAGTGTATYNGDNGAASSAGLYTPQEVKLDSSGNVYISDYGNQRIRKVTISTGIITTYAGSSTSGSYSGDNGPATSATLYNPRGLELDSAGNMYIADRNNARIRKVTSTGIITTVAGNGGTGSFSGDNGAATSAVLNGPGGVTVDTSGNIYIADTFNNRVRKVTVSTGIITTIAGSSTSGSYSGDNGPATIATFTYPEMVKLDSAGNIYISDCWNHRIRKVTVSTGIITTFAGNGISTYNGDNVAATSARLAYPLGFTLDSAGNVYIGDYGNQRIRKVTASTGLISTVAGSGTAGFSGDGGAATSAALYNPLGVGVDSTGNMYIADCGNHRVRKVTVTTNSPSVSPTSTASPTMYPSLSPSSVFIISTIAGTGSFAYSGDSGAASSASLNYPLGITLDTSGNVYIADESNNRIRKVTVSTGIISTIAGTGSTGYSGDNGPATSAALYYPTGVAVDASGNVYIADWMNNCIRKVTVSTGIITTIAGTGASSYSGDNGPATSATIYAPIGVALDTSGNVYITDTGNNRIRKVTVSTGIISTIAGSGSLGYSGDNGPATSAALSVPYGVVIDSTGNVFIGDTSNNRVRKVTVSTGIITTIAGSGTSGSYSGDNGPATAAGLYSVQGIALDSAGNLYIADCVNSRIRKVTGSSGIITTIAGTGTSSYSGDGGAATTATVNQPRGVVVDSLGNVFISDSSNSCIRKVTVTTNAPSVSPSTYPSYSPSTTFIITTIAGSSTSTSYSGDNGAATSAGLYYPCDAYVDPAGNLYIADTNNNCIRKVTISTGIITTIVGTGASSYSGDNGPATAAGLSSAYGIDLDAAGNMYIADHGNHRIRKVTASTNIITTIAGTGTGSYSGDNGQATAASLNLPIGIDLDSSGNIYIADFYNHRIRKVTVSTGIITTIAGSGGTGSYSGDGGAATSALLNNPTRVALDPSGNVYISDSFNNRIRKVTISTGIITTIAGNGGTGGFSGDGGAATSATLYIPFGLSLDSAGNIYFADRENNRIRKVAISTGIITTIAGDGNSYSGDNGQATAAGLNAPFGLTLDSSGNIYIADTLSNRIRKVTVTTYSPSMSPTSVPSTASPTTYPSLSPSSVFIISTIAGTGVVSYSGDNGAATSAGLYRPELVALDSAGNIYFADFSSNRIRKVTVSTGIITTIAGSSTSSSYSGDNDQATLAALNCPNGIELDSSGNVYIADFYNNRIRKVTVSTGIITTIAGIGTASYSGDNGQATAASLNNPSDVVIDSTGNYYIADWANHRVRKVTISTGIILTVAGTGASSYSGDNGPATSATLNYPAGVTLDSAGNVYITDSANHCVRKVTISTGIIATIAGTGASTYNGDEIAATTATFYYPYGITLDSAGNVYIADRLNHRIRKVTVSTGIITTIAGNGGTGSYSGDNGQATSAALSTPHGVALDLSGNVYISDTYNYRIRKVTITTNAPSMSPTSVPSTATPTMYPSLSPSSVFIISTIAGTGVASYSGDNGAATSAGLVDPQLVTLDSAGNIYYADFSSNRIRKVTVSTGIITTIAGSSTSGSYSGDNGLATLAALNNPNGVSVDVPGNVYITDFNNNRVRKVTVSTGFIATIAGTGSSSYNCDNCAATIANLNNPSDATVDSAGNVYIADFRNHRVRKVMVSTGMITTIAGTGTTSYSGDGGQATSATLNFPAGITLDSAGNVYLTDTANHCVRKVTISTGIIATIAGTGASTYNGDEIAATTATFYYPYGITLDSAGNVYIADRFNHRIRKVTISTGIISTIAGNGGTGSYSGDNGQATSAALNTPHGVALDLSGNVYISDSLNSRIRKVTITTNAPSVSPTTYPSLSPSSVFIISTIAGTGVASYSGDNGQATAAALNQPFDLVLDTVGNVYFGDFGNHRVRKVTIATGIISTIAGGGGTDFFSGDNGAATAATLHQVHGVSLDAAGNVYIGDSYNHRIRKVTVATDIITTIAGDGSTGYSGDNGAATSSSLYYPVGVTLDPAGNVYIADYANCRVRKVTVSTGILTTLAGTGDYNYFGDNGPATSAALCNPTIVRLDSTGNVYIADFYNHRIRKVTVSTGIITTIAGSGGTGSYAGDGGAATSASLNYPSGVTVDPAGNLYISDSSNNRVRKVTISTGIINTFAGTGVSSFSGDNGPATAADLNYPTSVILDSTGNVYIADYVNACVRKVTIMSPSTSPTLTPSTASPSTYPSLSPSSVFIMSTIAGTGVASYSGDNGQATAATLSQPYDLVLDTAGNVYFGDFGNDRVRKVTVSTGIISTIAGGGGTDFFSGDNGAASAATLHQLHGVSLDAVGNVYIGDSYNHRIRKVTVATDIITTIAGDGSTGYSGDNGAATSSSLYYPVGVTLDPAGNVYIADYANCRVRKVTVSTGILTTLAGTGDYNYFGDNGPATSAALCNPTIVRLDSTGNVYIADSFNHRIRKVTISTGIISTIAGNGGTGTYSGDGGAATSALLNRPEGVTVDAEGNLYISDTFNNRIRKVTISTGIITTFAGTGLAGFSGDGDAATSATLNIPFGVDVDSAGNVYISDGGNSRVRKVTTMSPSMSPTSVPSTASPSTYPSLSPSSVFIMSTIAGTGVTSYSGDNGQATAAELNQPYDLILDTAGNVYFSDYGNHRIRKVTIATGIISTLAGTGTASYSGDNGPATAASLYEPHGVSLDAAGNVYIGASYNQRIRKVTVATDIITTIAGDGSTGYSGDNGAATSSSLYYPVGVTLDPAGNVYIADYANCRVRKVTVSTGILTTIAGTGAVGYSGDNGPATSASLYNPTIVKLDSAGDVYIADFYNHRIRKVTISTGIITTIAGSGGTGSFSGDNGPATAAELYNPEGVSIDAAGNLYIADKFNHRVRKVTISTGIITTFAGTGVSSYGGDNGPATAANLYFPTSTTLDSEGNVYIADYFNARVRKVTVTTNAPSMSPSTATPSSNYPSLSPTTVFIISTVAGTGSTGYSGDNVAATTTSLYYPSAVTLDAVGNIYIADWCNSRIRKVTVSTGIITTIAGSTSVGYSGDNGPATAAGLNYAEGVALDAAGNVYIGDRSNHCIRKVTVSTGIITTIAGTGTASYSGDNGPATSAALNNPTAVAVDSSGNLYIADHYNHRIRKVTVSTGIITTLAGTGTSSYSGDNGPATSAQLNFPGGVALDAAGDVYISDCSNLRVRKVTISTGIITTIAGSGSATYLGDGIAATSTGLSYPGLLTLDSVGNVYIPDLYTYRVYKVTMATGIITTIAGSGISSYSGDNGEATSATLNQPFGVAVDAAGNVYIADSVNNRVRKVTMVFTSSPSVAPTRQPSRSPSAYPTYEASVRVYFSVTQGLTGISASTYSNSKVSNDALFKQTVASMLGYDSRKEDVTIQLVTDAVQSRRSLSTAAAVQVCEVMYSIATPTFIFNDTNHATAMFIQALNESIATGVFDLVLHANSGSSWQSTTTEYVIFSTASPSSSPTSAPTSAPTQRDNVVANLLTIPLDAEVAKAKVKYYLGTFMGYFLAIYICLYLYSFLRYGKLTATQLYDTSYQSDAHVRCSAATSNESKNHLLSDLYTKNALVQSNMLLEEKLKLVKQASTKKGKMFEDDSDALVEEEDRYSKGYREYMHQQRVLLGCSPFLYPEGYVLKIPCVSREIVFPPGRVEDILLYICHNHPLFSCFYFMDGSKLGTHGTRILYIGKDVAVFVLYQFSNMLLQYFMVDGLGLGIFINLFIITPSAVSVGLVLKYLYTCPFTETVEFQRRYAKYELTVRLLGRLAILPIMLIMFGSLIIACLFSSNRDVPVILVNYFFFVQFYGVILALVKAVLLFVDNYYYQLTLFGVLDVLCIGRLYKERILAEQLVVDVDYAYRINTYLCGLIRIQKILNRDDAIKAKWITTGGLGGDVVSTEATGGEVYDIEMTGTVIDDAVISLQMNPLTSNETQRNSVAFSMDGIFSATSGNIDDQGGGGYSMYGNPSSSNDTVIATENPIHSLAGMLNTVSLRPTATRPQESVRLNPFTARSNADEASDAAITAAEDDAALYLEYQTLHENHDEALYAIDGDSEVAVSFEEWKSRRKQFKQGTRGSFVKAFQVFEEREQLALEQLEQVSHSASVKNTLKLHSDKVKNVLAATRAFSAAANKPK